MMNEAPASCFFSPLQVAAWQIPDLTTQIPELATGVPPWRIDLPALQRGAVWRPRQVEALWDSLLRGFPIGAFLLAPYSKERGRRVPRYQGQDNGRQSDYHYHLLDGQQRWNAITLGFLNVWQRKDSGFKEALWVDLKPREAIDGRLFLFRVVTYSHPWGYRQSDPSRPLEVRMRRQALEWYQQAAESAGISGIHFRPGHFDIWHAWPWDAIAPVPFPLIVDAVRTLDGEAVWGEVARLLNQYLPYWAATHPLQTQYGDWKQKVRELLQDPTSHMQHMVDGVRENLGIVHESRYYIPVQILPSDVLGLGDELPKEAGGGQGAADPPDPIETLFVRVNSGGTTLDGEELRYSMLKAAYPAVQDIEAKLEIGWISPARSVTLLSRLVLSRTKDGQQDPPREPDVARFRRLVHGSDQTSLDFRAGILEYLGLNEHGQPIFTRARNLLRQSWELLTNLDDGHGPHDWRLPPVLAADLSRHSPDAFFLLLAWLDAMANAGSDPSFISDDDQRRIVGTLTTLGWFAERPYACLRALWKKLYHADGPQRFFSAGVLECCLQPTDHDALLLIPPLPPECLQEGIEKWVINAEGFDDPSGNIWKQEWYWWNHFSIVDDAKHWFDRHRLPEVNRITAWRGLLSRLWDKRQFVLYAQRDEILQWFRGYDPAAFARLEDTDRPWDFDHIHPYGYVGGRWRMPQIIKEWHRSIGNIRAWPLEVNRAQGNSVPRKKLGDPVSQEKAPPYNLTDGVRLRAASFIEEHKEWPLWKASTPEGDSFWPSYLAYPNEDAYGLCRPELIRAISSRWVRLYREWYSTLRIESLFDQPPSSDSFSLSVDRPVEPR